MRPFQPLMLTNSVEILEAAWGNGGMRYLSFLDRRLSTGVVYASSQLIPSVYCLIGQFAGRT